MTIIPLNDDTLTAGHAALHDYLVAAVCGSNASAAYARAMRRPGGIASVPGTINALIEQGIHDREELVAAAARVSRCRRTTVRSLVEAMTGDCASTNLWAEHDGELFFHEGVFGNDLPRFLIAA